MTPIKLRAPYDIILFCFLGIRIDLVCAANVLYNAGAAEKSDGKMIYPNCTNNTYSNCNLSLLLTAKAHRSTSTERNLFRDYVLRFFFAEHHFLSLSFIHLCVHYTTHNTQVRSDASQAESIRTKTNRTSRYIESICLHVNSVH